MVVLTEAEEPAKAEVEDEGISSQRQAPAGNHQFEVSVLADTFFDVPAVPSVQREEGSSDLQ